MTTVFSTDPRGKRPPVAVATETDPNELDAIVLAANEAQREFGRLSRSARASTLRAIAKALEAARSEIVALADDETALGVERLGGELSRTTGQFRFFADVLDDGGYLEIIIDHETADHPELRRWLRPLGAVAVFGASNFPLAFSVPGGDTASALAAGCPVVVKAHPSHPATSVRCLEAIRDGLVEVGLAPTTVGIVHGTDAGARLVSHHLIAAVGFTGSLRGGRVLFDLAAGRDHPIPFYGELGSLNPVVVSESAAAARGEDIAKEFVESFTLGGGQFCTKPGLLFVPAHHAARIVETVQSRVRELHPVVMLNASMASNVTERVAHLSRLGVGLTSADTKAKATHFTPPSIAVIDAKELSSAVGRILLEECFGPFAVIVEYRHTDDLHDALALVPKSLTATLHGEPQDDPEISETIEILESRSGRIVWNGFPTGVAVTASMTHGGPYPASTSPLHSSVGSTAIRRWLRPVTYQNMPEHHLPPDITDDPPSPSPRRIDGTLHI